MSRGTPSMLALLGLLAVAGYQHKDKLREMLDGEGQPAVGGDGNHARSDSEGGLIGGLRGLVDRFTQKGQGDTANSWVKTGANKSLAPETLGSVLSDDEIDTLTKKTGLSREELLARLSRTLPDAVDRYTPDGRLP